MPSGCRQPVTMTVRSDPSGRIERMRPPLTSRTNRRPAVALLPDVRLAPVDCETLIRYSVVDGVVIDLIEDSLRQRIRDHGIARVCRQASVTASSNDDVLTSVPPCIGRRPCDAVP